ncbi:MAG: hypothetical protein KGI71_05455, partial [Patescibacteria group bacterium]|nr:hypothetical protein [Patescibacteria group bacterium]
MASGKYPQSDRPALPEYLARKGQGKMKRAEVRSVVQGALTECANFVDNELSFERARATEYYLGKPFGNEEDGRSQAILTEVRDAVDAMLPSLMRVFFGPEHAVEFRPTRADTVEQAAQKTDYVRYVFEEENQGFLKTMQVLKDGLIRKIGIFKYHWDDAEEIEAFRQEGIDAQQLQMLYGTDGVEVTSVEPVESTDPNAPPLYDVDCTRIVRSGRVVVDAMPPEEFIFNRQARSLDTALILAHRTDKTRGELLAMGVKEKDIDDHAGAGSGSTDVSLQSNAEEIARRDVAGIGRVVGYGFTNDPEMGPENAKILYTEALMRLDEDGDGIAEWRRICCIGPAYYPVVD